MVSIWLRLILIIAISCQSNNEGKMSNAKKKLRWKPVTANTVAHSQNSRCVTSIHSFFVTCSIMVYCFALHIWCLVPWSFQDYNVTLISHCCHLVESIFNCQFVVFEITKQVIYNLLLAFNLFACMWTLI